MKIVDTELLNMVTTQAKESPRQRKNFNLHPSDSSKCHRLLNALEPDTYIRPHRHLDPEKDEGFIIMRGRLGVLLFSDNGEVTGKVLLSRDSGMLAVDIPYGAFHAAVSLESGTVFYETKAGPYLPLTEAETATWAPADTNAEAADYLHQLKGYFL